MFKKILPIKWEKLSGTAVFILLVPGLIGSAQAIDKNVLAEVGGVPVTRFEVEREAERILPLRASFHGGISKEKIAEVRKEALDRLIERAYQVRFALDEEIVLDRQAVDRRLEPVIAKIGSKEEFSRLLGSEGETAFRASIYRELLASKAKEVAVESQVQISDLEVRDHYEKNRASYLRPRMFRASHILVKVDPAATEEERAAKRSIAEQLLTRAQSGEDFYNLAYYHSDDRTRWVGGDLGAFHEGQAESELEQALKQMKPGEIAGLVESLYGFHILKLVEVKEPQQLTFEEMKEKIREQMMEKRRDTLLSEWRESLRNRYPVVVAQ